MCILPFPHCSSRTHFTPYPEAIFLSFFLFFILIFSVIYFHICPSSFVLFDCTAPFHFIARYFISSGKSFPLFYWFFFYFASYFYTFQIVSAHAAIKQNNNNNNNSVGRNHLFGRHTVHLFCRLFDLLLPLSALLTRWNHYVWVPQTKRNITQSKK